MMNHLEDGVLLKNLKYKYLIYKKKTLLRHEIMEKELIDKGFNQIEAYKITIKKYNYQKEAEEYYDKIEKSKKRK